MEDLHFYPPKIKNIFLLILAIAGTVAFGALTIGGLLELVWIAVLLGILPFLVFAGASYGLFFAVFRPEPYLLLTEEELTINAYARSPIPIKWDDILGYKLITQGGQQSVEIWLYNEEDYHDLFSERHRKFNRFSHGKEFTPFVIAWGQVKRKDRAKLAYELDRRAFGDAWDAGEDPRGEGDS